MSEGSDNKAKAEDEYKWCKGCKNRETRDDELRGFLRESKRGRIERLGYHTSCWSENHSCDR